MQDMRLDEIRAEDQVSDYPAVCRRSNAEGRFKIQTAGHPVRDWAHAAYSLRKMRGIERVSALKNRLKTPECCAVAFGVNNLLFAADVINRNFNRQVPFDSGYGVNSHSSWHFISPKLVTDIFSRAGSRCHIIRVGLNPFPFHYSSLWKLDMLLCLSSNRWNQLCLLPGRDRDICRW
jgi:hypothetical protein